MFYSERAFLEHDEIASFRIGAIVNPRKLTVQILLSSTLAISLTSVISTPLYLDFSLTFEANPRFYPT